VDVGPPLSDRSVLALRCVGLQEEHGNDEDCDDDDADDVKQLSQSCSEFGIMVIWMSTLV
jgi:hypothetical protein